MILLRICTVSLPLSGIVACSKPGKPDPQRRPDPQAHAAELRDVIRQPIDRAKATDAAVQAAADAQRAQIEAQTGG
ncbi:MAG TPA: hypothetical protein VNI56_00135 [Xanthomonadaceae bacterium]|nr:hypothetical protein [Xanthomonadaceae bacterium]